MNPKIKAPALKDIQGKRPDEVVTLKLRIITPLSEEIDLLTAWGGEVLYDNGLFALVTIQAGRVDEVAEWDKVLEII